MRAIHRFAALAFVASACSPATNVVRGPGSLEGMTQYRFNELVFEVPAGFELKRSGSGITLRFCTEPDFPSCGVLGVHLRADMAEVCTDKDRLVAWFRAPWGEAYGGTDLDSFLLQNRFLPNADDLKKATLSGREGWLFGNQKGGWRSLVVCDGPQSWVVREISHGEKGDLPARIAFNTFLKTARLETPAKPAP